MDLFYDQASPSFGVFSGKVFANRTCRKNRRIILQANDGDGFEKVPVAQYDGTEKTDKFGEFEIAISVRSGGGLEEIPHRAKIKKVERDGDVCTKRTSDSVVPEITR